jgi:hypothetical protein
MTEADTWFQFIEQVAGLRPDTVERNPVILREVQTRACEYLYETNPFETIQDLTKQVAELTEKVGRTHGTASDDDDPSTLPSTSSSTAPTAPQPNNRRREATTGQKRAS